jgi:hypothetical protein
LGVLGDLDLIICHKLLQRKTSFSAISNLFDLYLQGLWGRWRFNSDIIALLFVIIIDNEAFLLGCTSSTSYEKKINSKVNKKGTSQPLINSSSSGSD